VATAYTRATDSDRDDTCRVLDSALSEGQLSTEEHRQRVSAATRATTLGELRSLVSDLQILSAPAQFPRVSSPARGWGIWIAVVVAVVLAGLGIGWKIFGNTASSSQTPSAKPSSTSPAAITPTTSPPVAPIQLQTVDGLTGLLAQMRKEIGDAMGYRLVVHPDHADLDRADPQDAHSAVTYHYTSSGWVKRGASSIPATSTAGDLSKFNVQEVVGVLRAAPQTLQINGANSTYLMIESAADGSLALSIYVSNGHHGGYIGLKADGTVEQIHPPDN
jgi:hypothetical protein